MHHSKTVGTRAGCLISGAAIRPKSRRKHLYSYDPHDYVNLRSQIGADNIISNVGQRYNILSKGIIDLALIKECTKSDNPVIEAFYGYAFHGDSLWTYKNYKVWVKFEDTPHMLKIKFDAIYTDQLKKSNGAHTSDSIALTAINMAKMAPETRKTLNKIIAEL